MIGTPLYMCPEHAAMLSAPVRGDLRNEFRSSCR
jgi:hypothetical protein